LGQFGDTHIEQEQARIRINPIRLKSYLQGKWLYPKNAFFFEVWKICHELNHWRLLIMATILKRPSGGWQAKIRRKGFPCVSKTFSKKALAEKWAIDVESKMQNHEFTDMTVAKEMFISDLIHNYWIEVVQHHKSAQVTRYRLNFFIQEFEGLTFSELTTLRIKDFKERRLKEVCGDTVRKELILLKSFIDYAMKEWQITLSWGNPVAPISLPRKGKSRERRLQQGEAEQLMAAANVYGGLIGGIIEFALETGMRRGEIVKLKWEHFDSNSSTIRLIDTKNGEDRDVPLSTKALQTIMNQQITSPTIFDIKSDSITQAFNRVKKLAGLEDLRFHDLRHEATSRFIEKGFNVLETASITGHKI
jgi:integrase